MPKIAYIEKRFNTSSQRIISKANDIIEEYAQQGFDLTLRQLYYQFVSRDLLANSQKEYKRLGQIISDARLAGLVDWDAITDRTRSLKGLAHWEDPAEIVKGAAESFRLDKWADQKFRPEVWIEKDALAGVFERVCKSLDVPYFSCRGYTSQSEMWAAGQRMNTWKKAGQTPVVFHFGDHDPSGKDMTRDIQDRLNMFMGGIRLERLALNMDQVQKYNPPPNPAKMTDTRADVYVAEFGNESWELDALDPKVLAGLVEKAVKSVRDVNKWTRALRDEEVQREDLTAASDRWDEVVSFLRG